ncbi:MAG: PD-(D/E)XK nuclease domain-containing protein [Treponema sp.]|jgi:DNA polymerase III delta prime subunit|nr:PD-(D/E)XK nuclease domain-containing protein [Treponema sp.]
MSQRKVRFFNTTGPCNPDDHYMLPPEERLVGAQLDRYIRDKLYWVLHAPRQTGKTTFLQSWMREINGASLTDESGPIACYVTVEDCQGVNDVDAAMRTIYQDIKDFATLFQVPVPVVDEKDVKSLLRTALIKWAELVAPRPLIVLFDEVDVLQGEPLVSFLRQLRGGFAGRGAGIFPISIALVGMRDLKDYITAAKGGVQVNPGSPFNVKSDSASISNFQKEEVIKLFAQRTAETGQQITTEALDYVYDQSKGQPWIVNSLFQRATMRVLHEDDTETVTIEHIREARQQMIDARETHLDALAVRLRDPRIRQVIQTIITGEVSLSLSRSDPDVELTMDLGLVSWDTQRGFTLANPIYEEIMTRFLDAPYHDNLPPPNSWKWDKPNGTLDMDALLRNFQEFWRNNSETWEQAADYPEAFPHLLLMAFLQRITNGSGRIEREYAAGRGRMDLAVEYKGAWNIIEIKLLREKQSFETVKAEGIKQILQYRERISPQAPCYLLIFDRRPEKPGWAERLTWEDTGNVMVLGC